MANALPAKESEISKAKKQKGAIVHLNEFKRLLIVLFMWTSNCFVRFIKPKIDHRALL